MKLQLHKGKFIIQHRTTPLDPHSHVGDIESCIEGEDGGTPCVNVGYKLQGEAPVTQARSGGRGGGALQYEMLRCMKFQTSDSTLGLMTPYLQAFFCKIPCSPPPLPSSLPMPLTPSGSGVANRPSVALADRKK